MLEQAIHSTRRLEIAQHIIERKRAELAPHMLAGACYGSVAHNAASAYSDIEIVIITDESLELLDEYFFEQGMMVECTRLPASRMLTASQRVTENWGIQADQYRCHSVLWDPDDFFPRLWATAADLPQEAFDSALKSNWWPTYEIRAKLGNAVLAHHEPNIRYLGWEFAYRAAMHIALHERRPYESGRTLWSDVRSRGYNMSHLVDVVTNGSLQDILPATNAVWAEIQTWGAPEGVPVNG